MTLRSAIARSARMRTRLWPRGFVAAACVLGACFVGGASCSGNSGHTETVPTPPAIQHAELGTPDLRLLVVTDLKGYLEPCGCTRRPLGGIDRMAAQVASLRADGVPTVMVGAGDLFFEAPHGAGSERAGAETQEIWKAETLVQILDGMGMAAAVPGGLDLRFGASTFADLDQRATFPLLASGVSLQVPETVDAGDADAGVNDAGTATRTLALPAHMVVQAGGLRVGIFGVSDMVAGAGVADGVTAPTDLEAQALTAATALREEGADIVIALVRAPRRIARRIASQINMIDFVVEGGLDEADANPPAVVEHGAILTAGRQGQGLLVVDIHRRSEVNAAWTDVSTWTREVERTRLSSQIDSLRARIAEWEHDSNVAAADVQEQRTRLAELETQVSALTRAPTAIGSAFEARLVELDPDAARDASTTTIINAYSQRVNEHNRVAFASWFPEAPGEGMPHYVGSETCASCHAEEFSWWRSTAHGRAYATLEDVHKEFNLSCVGCHVTGYLRPGGATVSHVGLLEDVGCENCHGPGSGHIASPAEATFNVHRDATEATCLGCHTPEHSDGFNYEAYRRVMVVPGHGLPSNGAPSGASH